jgi:hypothetical protein
VRRECIQLIRRTNRHHVVDHVEPQDVRDPAPPVDHALLTDERDLALTVSPRSSRSTATSTS